MPRQLKRIIDTNPSFKNKLESLSISGYCALISGAKFPSGAIEIEALAEHFKISIFIINGEEIYHYKHCGQEEEKETEAAAVEKPCQLFIEWKEGAFQPRLLTGGLEDNDYTLLPPGEVFNFFPVISKIPPKLAGTSSMSMSDDSSSASDEERSDEKRPTF